MNRLVLSLLSMVICLLCVSTGNSQLLGGRVRWRAGNWQSNPAPPTRQSQQRLPVPVSFYIDEKELPFDSELADLAKKYPNIIIDGEKLDFDAASGHYVYAGTKERAMFLSGNGEYILSTPTKRDPRTGKVSVRVNGKWQASTLELPPDLPSRATSRTPAGKAAPKTTPKAKPEELYRIESGAANAPS